MRLKPAELQKLLVHPGRILCIDIGNSRAKATIFEQGVQVENEEQFNPVLARVWLQKYALTGAIIASVGEATDVYADALAGHIPFIEASSALRLPFDNRYRSPRLGVDRLAGICGAMLYTDKNALILDAGTCMTYDVLTDYGVYMGGAISPGPAMRLRAMHTFTAGLPLLSPVGEPPLAGLSTEDCMMSGALNGLRFETQCYYDQLAQQYPNLEVLLTGGAATVLYGHVKAPVTVYPTLVTQGLLLLYHYQALPGR